MCITQHENIISRVLLTPYSQGSCLFYLMVKSALQKINVINQCTIANYFEPQPSNNQRYNLRKRQNPTPSFRSNTMLGKKSIQNEGTIFWNDLPPYLKDIDSLIAFKKLLKSFLISPWHIDSYIFFYIAVNPNTTTHSEYPHCDPRFNPLKHLKW